MLYRLRAWMLVLPVDAVMLMAPAVWAPQQVKAHVTMSLLFVLLVTRGGRYRARLHLSVLDELPGLLTWLLTCAALVATVSALRHDQVAVTNFLDNAAIAVCMVVAGRLGTTWLINWSRRRRLSVHPTVVIGGGPLTAELVRILSRYPRYGLNVVGFVADGAQNDATGLTTRLGGTGDLDNIVRATEANVLLVADGELSERVLLDAVRTPACLRCDLLIVPRLHHFATQTGMADHIGSIPIMRIHQPSITGPARLLKRAFDLVAGSIALTVVAPVIAVCAIAVRIDGGAGVFFRQTRVGRDGELFDLIKLRTVRPVSPRDTGATEPPPTERGEPDMSEGNPSTEWSVSDSARVSSLGRLLRRLSLDELPQIWNVLRGDMTLVGPRPERPYFVEQFSAKYDRYGYRHRVQVGLTGLAQVSGLRGDTSIADRARHDNYYIENWSLWLDVKIIIRTFFEVFLARGR
jgi:exopolysaccharide biosynthesis polyprenyl glycosylphosphotransferase